MKRGSSGLSMVLGVLKPSGMTSHDVVSRVRRVFGEKRVGHAGTLDPFASGVLPILVGPATRLDKYMTSHDKSYVAEIAFGTSTTTDDRCGDVIHEDVVPDFARDAQFASETLESFEGPSMQMPPAYSAIKVDGRKACDEARKGNLIRLEPRPIEVYSARMLEVVEDGDDVAWKALFHVSKGTYIRALARDIGKRIGVPAHLRELKRRNVGCIDEGDCVPLDALDSLREKASIDPVRLLGMRVVFVDAAMAASVRNGGFLNPCKLSFYELRSHQSQFGCSCMPSMLESCQAPAEGELFAVVSDNRLAAIYRFDELKGMLVPDCVFQVEVSRGADI